MYQCSSYVSRACCADIVEAGTYSPILTSGLLTGVDTNGFSAAVNSTFHSPAHVGTQLHVIGTAVSVGSRSLSTRCETFYKATSRLLVSATHSVTPLFMLSKTPTAKTKRTKGRL
ncbi:hypothetical protein DAEQUDRAFT_455173 [Daedalea quercina L-15889]|uniref:Thioesterase domain-containing protein n=1 Tax=Daedalea quercina L-15889 TaxID=1314783 RepID=A0A165N307_9APHY|nr:hypothetical protein DAEQUDRAFT_455173 [Daedalea quercina L-15889]